jgi:hypothetical protein
LGKCGSCPIGYRPGVLFHLPDVKRAGMLSLGLGDMMGLAKRIGLAASVAAILLTTACSHMGPSVCQCPTPVAYDDATIKRITQALRNLPPDNVLHRTMDDYEDERDDLRACLAGAK